MLQTIIDTCEFKQEALDYALSKQIEDLSDLAGHSEADARAFFDKTYVTDGMALLLRQGLQRLAGISDQAAFELRQAMGGGKTHSMLALGYLAAHPEIAKEVSFKITDGFTPVPAKTVVISGRNVDHDKFLWGSVAEQLGKADEFSRFWRNGAVAPNEADWVKLIGNSPVLILIDELPPYLENDLPPSERSKINVTLDHGGDWECRSRNTSRRRLSASCERLRSYLRRARRLPRRVGGSRLASKHTSGGARNMAV